MGDAPALSNTVADERSFSEHISKRRGCPVMEVFENLGRDATLLAPTNAAGNTNDYAHIATFLRGKDVPPAQRDAAWRQLGHVVSKQLRRQGVAWVSTDGRGVAWLHLRIEAQPKYFKTHRYRDHQDKPSSASLLQGNASIAGDGQWEPENREAQNETIHKPLEVRTLRRDGGFLGSVPTDLLIGNLEMPLASLGLRWQGGRHLQLVVPSPSIKHREASYFRIHSDSCECIFDVFLDSEKEALELSVTLKSLRARADCGAGVCDWVDQPPDSLKRPPPAE